MASQPSISMASEIGFLGRRLLTSCSIRGTCSQASQAIRQPLWAQPRNFSTSVIRFNNEPSSFASKPATKEPTVPNTPAQTSTPRLPFSKTAAPRSKKADSPYAYDATSDGFDIAKLINFEHDDFLQKHYPATARTPEIRTRPATGRTFQVTAGRDFFTAIKTLEINVAKNRIKRLWQMQKRHERPGLKRKRLKAERFKRRFKEGFSATVRRVQELTNQGW
ncbi:hypothetical protein CkaCkLH20_07721 [Colletotrichum karsti]|uniref:Ribosomal protein S21 n=1 Tax=Colletotrichum karsti TaxID=1095194 RepID=A0A9P6I216_9PEZI|nr:uncharacterized protein CkaCkLH20_07721 [Colletotrichum karsti]KAF9874584.1 hypothetical protein CkaCkLH20_07721 [Colletotrichum karsti]